MLPVTRTPCSPIPIPVRSQEQRSDPTETMRSGVAPPASRLTTPRRACARVPRAAERHGSAQHPAAALRPVPPHPGPMPRAARCPSGTTLRPHSTHCSHPNPPPDRHATGTRPPPAVPPAHAPSANRQPRRRITPGRSRAAKCVRLAGRRVVSLVVRWELYSWVVSR